mgnify:CR=1 FL=1
MEKKKLYKTEGPYKMVCGVCGGIAEYFNIDPTLIRLLVAILCLFSCFTGIVAYIIAAVIIPEEGAPLE